MIDTLKIKDSGAQFYLGREAGHKIEDAIHMLLNAGLTSIGIDGGCLSATFKASESGKVVNEFKTVWIYEGEHDGN